MATLTILMPEPKAWKGRLHVAGADTILSDVAQTHPYAKSIEARISQNSPCELSCRLDENSEYVLVLHWGRSALTPNYHRIKFEQTGLDLLKFVQRKVSFDAGYLAFFKVTRHDWKLDYQINGNKYSIAHQNSRTSPVPIPTY